MEDRTSEETWLKTCRTSSKLRRVSPSEEELGLCWLRHRLLHCFLSCPFVFNDVQRVGWCVCGQQKKKTAESWSWPPLDVLKYLPLFLFFSAICLFSHCFCNLGEPTHSRSIRCDHGEVHQTVIYYSYKIWNTAASTCCYLGRLNLARCYLKTRRNNLMYVCRRSSLDRTLKVKGSGSAARFKS